MKYSNKPIGGIPTQMQNLLRQMERYWGWELDVTKGGYWYIRIKRAPFNIMAWRKYSTPDSPKGIRGFKFISNEKGFYNHLDGKQISQIIKEVRPFLSLKEGYRDYAF